VQSEWDIARQRAPDYAGTMADLARVALEERKGPQHVLLLGLGGGTIAADLLCGAGRPLDWRLECTSVEFDADVAEAARQYFMPCMFAHSPESHERLHVVIGDAVKLVTGSTATAAPPEAAPRPLGGPYDVLIEDFAYEQPGWLKPPFWRRLRALAAPDATLLINTMYDRREQMEGLAHDLRTAGWRDVCQRVDRGLQAAPGEARCSDDPASWQPRDNMIFACRNRT
jgi:spermidine synthase